MPKAINRQNNPSETGAAKSYKSYEINAETKRVEESKMNKLKEIKEIVRQTEIDRKGEEGRLIKDMRYLLSLLEEKDKALAFLADDSNWSWWGEGEDETVTWIGGTDPQHAARTALNTTKEERTHD